MVERYAAGLRAEAERYGAQLGAPRHDDDAWDEKLAIAAEARAAVVSFAFGCPASAVIVAPAGGRQPRSGSRSRPRTRR